jgi:hypothetical protein
MKYLPLTSLLLAGLASAQAPPAEPGVPAAGAGVVAPAIVMPLAAVPPPAIPPAAQIAVEPAANTMGAPARWARLRPDGNSVPAGAVSDRPEFFHGGP